MARLLIEKGADVNARNSEQVGVVARTNRKLFEKIYLEFSKKCRGETQKIILNRTHLSKGTSDLKPKCTQLATPFWGTVFHALSHGVIYFVRSVRSRKHFLIG